MSLAVLAEPAASAVPAALAAPVAWSGAVLAVAGLALTPLVLELAARTAGPRAVFFARWGFSHFVGVVLAGLAALLAAGALLPDDAPLGPLLRAQAFFAGAAATALWQSQRLDPDGWRGLGLRRGEAHGRAASTALLLYALAWPALVGLSLCWPALLAWLGVDAPPQPALELAAARSGAELLPIALLAVVVAPALEELCFRGYLQPLLVQNFSERGGLLATALLFAGAHGGAAFLPALALGLLLGLVRLRTRSLPACIAVHALHNAVVLAALAWLPGTRSLVGLLGPG